MRNQNDAQKALERRIFVKEKHEKKEHEKENNAKQTHASVIKYIAIVLIIAILAVAIFVVAISENINKEKQGEEISAMATRGDYIKEIKLVTEDNEYMTIQTDAEGVQVPVPKGYVGSTMEGENTVEHGYVIYEGTDPVNTEDIWNERNTRNQYVWVPVTHEQLSKMYGIDENGKYWGKLYDFTMNTGNNIDETTGATPLNWTETNGVMKIISIDGHREPDITSDIDGINSFRQYGVKAESLAEYLTTLEKEFEETLVSIAKYGGFYIGRYETGDVNSTLTVHRMNTNIGGKEWYILYEKCKQLRGNNKNVLTNMLYGSQYDRMLMWLIESGNKTKEQIILDSSDWGVYQNFDLEYDSDGDGVADTTKIVGRMIPSGSSEQTNANNIYDIGGNYWEWTMEANGTNSRIYRAGWASSYSGDVMNAKYRSGWSPNGNYVGRGGCRAALYIK